MASIKTIRPAGLLCALALFSLGGCGGAEPSQVSETESVMTMQDIRLSQTSEVLLNPGMGWILLDTALPEFTDCGRSGEYPLINNIGIMTTWGRLEPQNGVYDWALVDDTVAYWTSKGKRISFRMSTDDFPYYGRRLTGCPDWLYALGVDYQDVMYEDEHIPLKYPNLNHPLYAQYLKRFLTAFADRYAEHPDVDVVGLRGYGLWGEWHSGYTFDTWEDRVRGLQTVIGAWAESFAGRTHLSLNYSHEWLSHTRDGRRPQNLDEFMYYSALDYALGFDEISFEREGAYGAMESFEWTFNENTFRLGKMQIAEIAGGYRELKRRQQADGKDHARAALLECLKLHPNYITVFGWDQQGSARQFCDEREDLLQLGLLNMGYRLVPVRTRVASHVARGGVLEITQTWENTALGRCFEEVSLQVSLIDAGGHTAVSAFAQDFDLQALTKSEPAEADIKLSVPAAMEPGVYTLCVSLVDKNGEAVIALPLENGLNNVYALGAVTVT